MKRLQHSPDKYPFIANYSGWEVVEDFTIEGRTYPHSLPIYCTEDTETWYIQLPLLIGDETITANFTAPSAQALLGALNAIKVGASDEER